MSAIIHLIDDNLLVFNSIKNFSLSGNKQDFVKDIIRNQGIWSNGDFYPYHRFKYIEF